MTTVVICGITIETAIVYWKQDIETAKLRRELTRQNQRLRLLDMYIVHMLELAELVSRKRLTADNIETELTRIRDFTHAAGKAAKKPYDNE